MNYNILRLIKSINVSDMYRQNAHNMSFMIINDRHKFSAWDQKKTNQLWSPRQQDGCRYSQLYNSAEQFYITSWFETRSSLSVRNVAQPLNVINNTLQAYNVMKHQLVWASVCLQFFSETIAQNLVWTFPNLLMRSA